MSTDFKKPTDLIKPAKVKEVVEKTKAQIEKLTKKLEQGGVDKPQAGAIADKINALAEGPISHNDWMKMDVDRFSPVTKMSLDQQGLKPENILTDPDKAEDYVGAVFKLEGMPNGNGGTDMVKDIGPGHYDQAGHGIDLVAADADGTPVPIEVKKYNQPSAAHLEDRSVVELEPSVEQWRQQREAQVMTKEQGAMTDIRPDAEATWKPEVKEWQQQVGWDELRMHEHKGELPVQQMDDLWTRDRWLKIIKTPEGQGRMRQLGIDEKFLNHRHLSSSPDLPEWQAILDQRSAVIVSGGKGDVGKHLFNQAIRENRVKQVMKIEV